MNEPATHPLETILQHCAQAAPEPLYPAAFAAATGMPREQLNEDLDRLRLAGLLRLTDWVQGRGQGYALTPRGTEVLQSPRQRERLRKGLLPAAGDGAPGLTDLRGHRGTAWERGEAARMAMAGATTLPVVTVTLFFLNVLVFLAGLVLATSERVPFRDYLTGQNTPEVRHVYHQLGFLTGADVYVHGQWWRLLTACFNHIGALHLAFNMVTLLVAGPLVERMWGPGWYLVIYLLAGVGGSCGMLIENPVGGGAGASGALFGIFASMATWVYLHRQALGSYQVHLWRGRLILIVFLMIYNTFGIEQVSKGGHIGGGVVGLAAGLPVDLLRFGRAGQRALGLVGLAAIPMVCVAVAVRSFETSGPRIERADFQDAREHYSRTWNETARFFNEHVLPLMIQPPAERGPETVREALAGLARYRDELNQLANHLETTGPYRSGEVDQARRQQLQQVQDLLGRLDRARQQLAAAPETPASSD